MQESEWIKEGVKKYGEGRWKAICLKYPFQNRTSVMIKDRWRTMKKLGMLWSRSCGTFLIVVLFFRSWTRMLSVPGWEAPLTPKPWVIGTQEPCAPVVSPKISVLQVAGPVQPLNMHLEPPGLRLPHPPDHCSLWNESQLFAQVWSAGLSHRWLFVLVVCSLNHLFHLFAITLLWERGSSESQSFCGEEIQARGSTWNFFSHLFLLYKWLICEGKFLPFRSEALRMKIVLHFSTVFSTVCNCLLFPCEKFQFCLILVQCFPCTFHGSILVVSSKGATCSCLQVPKLEQLFVK